MDHFGCASHLVDQSHLSIDPLTSVAGCVSLLGGEELKAQVLVPSSKVSASCDSVPKNNYAVKCYSTEHLKPKVNRFPPRYFG